MTALGEFLERFYGRTELFRTLHARVRHTEIATSESTRRPPIGRRRHDTESHPRPAKDLMFWAHMPDKVRVESQTGGEGENVSGLVIVNGNKKWQCHPNGTVETESSRHKTGEISLPTVFQRHFDRRLLRQCFAALTLEPTGVCQVAGYECIVIEARHVAGIQLWPHWLSFHANEFEFAANAQYAVLLSIKAKIGETTVEAHEVLEATFNQSVDDSLFVYEPDANEGVQAAAPVAERTTFEAAARGAPFTVYRPEFVPELEHISSEVTYHPARPGVKAERVMIWYQGAKLYDRLWITQRSTPDEERQRELVWDELLVDGQRMAFSDPHPEEGLRVLACRLENTYVTIVSDLPKDDLVKIALSLRPVASHS